VGTGTNDTRRVFCGLSVGGGSAPDIIYREPSGGEGDEGCVRMRVSDGRRCDGVRETGGESGIRGLGERDEARGGEWDGRVWRVGGAEVDGAVVVDREPGGKGPGGKLLEGM